MTVLYVTLTAWLCVCLSPYFGANAQVSFYSASDNGFITSPNYPNNYPKNALYLWEITADAGHVVRLTFHDFNVEFENICDFDDLEIIDPNVELPKHLCGEDLPGDIISRGNTLRLLFESDNYVNRRGFNISYSQELNKIKKKKKLCGALQNYNASDNGFITTPNYPHRYPASETCEYVITADKGHVVRLTFHDFNVELDFECEADKVQIMDVYGDAIDEPLCGKKIPSDVISRGNKLKVVFTSDRRVNRRGFFAAYSQELPKVEK